MSILESHKHIIMVIILNNKGNKSLKSFDTDFLQRVYTIISSNKTSRQKQLLIEKEMFENIPCIGLSKIQKIMDSVVKDFEKIALQRRIIKTNVVERHLYNPADCKYKIELLTKKILSMFYSVKNVFTVRRSVLLRECTDSLVFMLSLDINRYSEKCRENRKKNNGDASEELYKMLQVSNKMLRLVCEKGSIDKNYTKSSDEIEKAIESLQKNKEYQRYLKNKDKAMSKFILDVLELYKKYNVFGESSVTRGNKVIISYTIRHNIFYNRISTANFETLPMVCKPTA